MKTIRVADYIARRLSDHGIEHAFLVTGGGAMHLNDAIGRERRLRWVAFHHEQACAMAADSYFRMSGRMAAVNVTTGPGATNAITGVYGAHVDSLAMFVVSGQVKRETMVRFSGVPELRQLGDQEVDIVPMVRGITKYAACVEEPASIRAHMDRALAVATTGRPGPVWLDVPIDVQAAPIDPEALAPATDGTAPPSMLRGAALDARVGEVLRRLRASKRPVILPGCGVRLAGAVEAFHAAIARLGIPVATAFNAHDLLADDHPLYVGRPGTVGDRPGNFAVQNADFLLVLGCRLNIRQVGYNFQSFARHAHRVMVDADAAEMGKPTLRIDDAVHADLKDFLDAVLAARYVGPTAEHTRYLGWCRERRERYPVVLAEYRKADADARINPYVFIDELFRALPTTCRVVTGDGTACVCAFQAARLKAGQRLYSSSGSAPMGYDLPAAIGAAFAAPDHPIVCLAGDGSIMMNLQELQTIVTHRLPIRIYVLENGGYHSIRQTQKNYFADNLIGFDAKSGVGFPDYVKLAQAFGMRAERVSTLTQLQSHLRDGSLSAARLEPSLVEVSIDPDQPFAPKASSRKLEDGRMVSAPLEDLAPFLSRDEFRSNMLVPPLDGG